MSVASEKPVPPNTSLPIPDSKTILASAPELHAPDFQDILKLEFAKLHKEFRLLENSRHGFAQKEGYMHMRAEYLVPLLEKDRRDLRHELRNAQASVHLKKVEEYSNSMREALESLEVYQNEIAKTRKQLTETEMHVDKITEKLIKQKFKVMAIHGHSRTLAERERDLMRAENKLYHQTCAFNLQIQENKRLRDEINDLLRARATFFKTHNGLKRQLSATKKRMLLIVQLAMQTYDARDESMSKVKALREREAKDVKVHEMDVQEFQRSFHHDRKTLYFVKTKLKKRPVIEEAQERRLRQGEEKIRELDDILRKYRHSFRKIMEYSKTHSIANLLDTYKSYDSSNYELFRYITNLTSECEVLREAVLILKQQIEEAHVEVEARKKEQRQLREKLQLAVIAHQEHSFQLEQQKIRNGRKLGEILNCIKKAMTTCKADSSSIRSLLGNKNELNVDRNSVKLCLTELDIKISELKEEQNNLNELKKSASQAHAQGFKYGKPKQYPSHGGPFVPEIYMLSMDTLDEEDTDVIMQEEPYYYNDMREFLFLKMVEDGQINTSLRTVTDKVSVELHPEPQPDKNKRKSLIEKLEMEGRKTRHTLHIPQENLTMMRGSKGKSIAGPEFPEVDENALKEIESYQMSTISEDDSLASTTVHEHRNHPPPPPLEALTHEAPHLHLPPELAHTHLHHEAVHLPHEGHHYIMGGPAHEHHHHAHHHHEHGHHHHEGHQRGSGGHHHHESHHHPHRGTHHHLPH